MRQVYVYQTTHYDEAVAEMIDMKDFRIFCMGLTPEDISHFPDKIFNENYQDIKLRMYGDKQYNIRLRPDTKAVINDIYSRKVAAALLIMYAYKENLKEDKDV